MHAIDVCMGKLTKKYINDKASTNARSRKSFPTINFLSSHIL